MSLLTEFLKFEYENEYSKSPNKLYSEPKIYNANGDLSRRWYVYYSFRNPVTGKLTRQTPIYGGVNTFSSKSKRLELLSIYRESLSKFLQEGFNPYAKENDFLHKIASRLKETIEKSNLKTSEKKDCASIDEAFTLALTIKKKVVSNSSYVNYESKLNKLRKWLKHYLGENARVGQITKKHIVNYLNEVLERTSPRTRNNTRTELGSLFQTMVDNELIPKNYVHSINVLRTRPERNKTYTSSQHRAIYRFLEDNDPILLLFIQFISYNFLRPIEVCRLRIKDLDIADRKIHIRAKNKPVKIKIIPDIMVELLPNLEEYTEEYFLFTPTELGAEWNANEISRRDYFSKRFKNLVKKKFGLGKEYGLYSFRHTFITKLYQEMIKTGTPYEVKSRLMLITGHSSMSSLEKYLRDIDAELPQDYSEYF